MRITHVPLLSLLALAGCSKADAATVDPSSDFDCALTSDFFHEASKIQGAPDDQRHALFVLNQWYAARWNDKHQGDGSKDRALAIVNAMGKDPNSYKNAIKACIDRAVQDPKFNRFAGLMKDVPEPR